jgi:hypothetical protein
MNSFKHALSLRRYNHEEPEDKFISRKFGSMSTDEGKAVLTEHAVNKMADGAPIDMSAGFKAIVDIQMELKRKLEELNKKLGG